MKYFYLFMLLLIGTTINLHAQQVLIKDIISSGGEATGAAGSASFSVGQTLVPLAENCGGSAQNGVQQPEYTILNLVSSFNATDTSDAYITLSWTLQEDCFKNFDDGCRLYPDGVLIELLAGTERIYSDIVYDANGDLSDSYRHFVGPNSSVDYTLNVFIRGNGAMACDNLMTTGSTISYQPPTDLVASQGTFPDKVELSWTNNSELSSSILIFRELNGEQTLIASLPGTDTINATIKFTDEFTLGDSLSLADGQMYTYCLRTYNEQLDEVQPGEECTDGSTLDVNFQAFLSGMDQVSLSWSNMAAFAGAFNIRRNGVLIATVSKSSTTYTDVDPTFGDTIAYQLDLLDATENLVLRSEAEIITPAIGEISGFVRTPAQIGIPDIKVKYTAIIGGDTLQGTATADYRGYYQFDDLFYSRGASFSLRAIDQGRFTFPGSGEAVTLNNANPIVNDINIYANEDYPLSLGSSLSIDTIIPTTGIDELSFDWEYTSTGVINDPLHFQLFREGELIDITDDTQPLPLELLDRSGNAGFIYKYSVVGYGFKGDSLVIGSRIIRDTMPDVTAPSNFQAVEDHDAVSENMITLLWDHVSDNFDGFRLYREMDLIAILEPGENSFYDYFAPPGAAVDYMLTAYRIADDGTTIESESAILNAVSIPALPALINLIAAPTPDNSVDLGWSLPMDVATYDNLSGFIIYRDGEAVLRSIKQGEDYLIREYCGPIGAVNYSIAPYLYAGDTIYVGNLQVFPPVNFPSAAAPVISIANPSPDGYVEVEIDPLYAQTNLNYDGYVLFADNVPFDTLMPAELTAYFTPNLVTGMASLELRVNAFRELDGNFQYGAGGVMNTNVPAQAGPFNLQAPSNFQASEHIPMHVTLSWDYPDYIFATFKISRNGVPIDTLPTEARYYYDIDAVPGEKNIYSIQAMYEGERSPFMSDEGQRRGQAYILGQILTQDYSSGLNKIPVHLREGASLIRRTFTNESGFFCFDQLPAGTGNYTVSVNAERSDLLLQESSLNLQGLNKETAIFQDAISIASEPPLPLVDSFATVSAFELKPLIDEGGLVASWSLNEGIYEGTTVNRGLTTIDPVEVDNPMFLIDSSGVGGIGYTYTTSPYIIDDSRRVSFDTSFSRSLDTDYPVLEPVEYLSALGAVNDLDNSVTLQWSHHTGKLTYYELLRNGLPLYEVPADSNLIFVDTTGKPDQQYTYQLRAVRLVDGNITISDSRTVSITYPEVARPQPFSATAVIDSNAVYLEWSYNGDALSGFRIFRNGEIIANLSNSDTTYYDYSGFPGADTEYRVVAILERGEMQFQSRASIAETVFPALRPPYDAIVSVNEELGLVEGSFKYWARGVNRFRIYRYDTQSGSTAEITSLFYSYDSTEQVMEFIDLDGTPGDDYEYQVVAEGERAGITFESMPATGSINSYPYPPVLNMLSASQDNENWVDLEWSLPLNANVDGFLIYRLDGPGLESPDVPNPAHTIEDYLATQNLELVESLDLPIPGKRTYQDVFASIIDAPIGEFNYVVAGYRDVNGETFSAPLRADNGSLGVNSPVLWTGGNNGTIWGWTGDRWADYNIGNIPDNSCTYVDFWGTKPDDAWVIGGCSLQPGDGIIARWDGNVWTEVDMGGEVVSFAYDIWGTSSDQVWVADIDGILYWNGTNWTRQLNALQNQTFYAIWGTGGNNVWAGANGAIYKYDGDTWQIEFSAPGESFRGIWGTDADNVWIASFVNNTAKIYKWDGQQLNNLSPDISNTFYRGVWSGSNNRAWAVGSAGTIAAWDAGMLTLQSSGTTENLLGIWGENEERIWTVGTGSTILQYNGQTWSAAESVPENNISLRGIETSVTQTVNYVSASKGTFANRTRIEWQYFGDPSQFEGFNLYRDEELIATLNPSISFYNDSDGIPGKPYVYTVKVYTADNEFLGKADIGYTKGNGQIEGEVITAIGSVPIEGAMLIAEADIEGERYTYEATTNNSGQYILDSLYIGNGPVSYTVTVSYLDHGFTPGEQVVALSPQNNTRPGIFFIDTTSYAVKGQITYQGGCPIDSITVKAKQFLTSGDIAFETTQTDANGNYSLILRPDLPGLEQIVIEAEPVFIRNQGLMDTEANILHQFAPSTQTLDLNELLTERVLSVNFVDTLTYDLKISVENVCGNAASSNGLFDIEVSTTDGCFLKTVQTNITGNVTAKIPPLDDLTARVVSASPLSLENNLIVDYLEYRPVMVDLEAFHINNSEYNEDGELVLINPDTVLDNTLVYHRPATINLANEFGMRPTCNPEKPRLINQEELYSIRFEVTEEHQGEICNVTEGYLIINNSAAKRPEGDEEDKTKERLEYIPSTGQFEVHSFTGGTPNLVFPHLKGINIQYFSASGDLVAEKTIPVAILGGGTLPGSDIIVDVEDSEGQVKYPIYILRDPPGDISSSSIEEGQTITKSISNTFSGGVGGGLSVDLAAIPASVGTYLNMSVIAGESSAGEKTFELSTSVNQTISTSSGADFVGPDADVLVGVGVAIQYGITELVDFNEETCKFEKIQTVSISPNEIKTDWLYTVGQIKQLVNEYNSQIDSVKAGTLTINRGGAELEDDVAIAFLTTLASNWEDILRYHAFESVPFYRLCQREFDANQLWQEALFYGKDEEYKRGIGVFGQEIVFTASDPDEDFIQRVENAEDARNVFCSDPTVAQVMNRDIEELELDALNSIVFTTDLAEKYDQASRAVEYWLDSLYLSKTQIENRLEDEEIESFIPRVENTTFSAGVTIDKSIGVTRGISSKYTQSAYFDFDIGVGANLKVVTGFGFFAIMRLADVNSKVGFVGMLDFEWSRDRYRSTTQETTTSYTLGDDDIGDQYSITAIRSREPGHTPYFQLLGGRTSCPPEAGAIERDRFQMKLYDPETQATFDFQELPDIDPDQPATFYLQLANINPFGEQRDLFVYHDAASNDDGATIKLNGGLLGGGNQSGQTFTFINPNQPFVLPLTVTRAPDKYQFDSIYIVMRPSCTDGDLYLYSPNRDTVTISAFFEHPCSDITISSPGDNWLITRRNPLIDNSRETLVIKLTDYEATNPLLEKVYLEYRRLGDGSPWYKIPRTRLGPPAPQNQTDPVFPVSNEFLIQFNEENFGDFGVPVLPVTWDITELYDEFPDGEYEIRAVSSCGQDGVVFSNIITGEIRRQTDDLFFVTEPRDGIWEPGDAISVKINKELGCAPDTSKFFVVSLTTGDTIMGGISCSPTDNTLEFFPDEANLLSFDGQLLEATVFDLNDGANPYPDVIRWRFRVISRDFYAQDTCLETTIYQDREGFLSTTIFNNTSSPLLDYVASYADVYPWLTTAPAPGVNTAIPEIVGKRITFTIDGANLPVGDTTAIVRLSPGDNSVNGGMDSIKIKVNVLARPPYWEVDPSEYSTSMTVTANYEYQDDPGELSTDTMDLISAWIDNEIRGVSPILRTDAGPTAALIVVNGDPEDADKPIEFRVWDADPGMEYNAYPSDTLYFDAMTTKGTFTNPEILYIDKEKDKARYIPVNGDSGPRGGLTWLSFNSIETNRSVNAHLRELIFAQNGDIIKTGDNRSAGYLEGVGWISTNGLDTLRPKEGYILYLGGIDDTIRITGYNAPINPITLSGTWNLIGYPLQDTLNINTALSGLQPQDAANFIRTEAQNPDLPGLSANMGTSYENNEWVEVPNGMEVLRPNFAYQIRTLQNAVLTYPNNVAPLTETSVLLDDNFSSPVYFDPADVNTWQVDPSEYPSSMVITASATFGGQLSDDPNDKVAAFVNGECRGVSPLYYVNALNKYVATLFVYGNNGGDDVQILMYDASEDEVYLCESDFTYLPNDLIGTFSSPYEFNNLERAAAFTTTATNCAVDETGTLEVVMVTGLEAPYSYQWSTGDTTDYVQQLTAGEYTVTITGQLGLTVIDSVAVPNGEVAIPMPAIETSAGNPACRGTDVALYALPPVQDAQVSWYDANGQLLQEGEALLLENLSAATSVFAQTDYRGCVSDSQWISLEVYQPNSGFAINPTEEVTNDTEVAFIPEVENESYQYLWDFGDANTSTESTPQHQYELPGLYTVTLEVADETGCASPLSSYELWVEAATNYLELESGRMSLQAMPNPFSLTLRAEIEVPEAGNYQLQLHSMQGQLIQQYEYDWEAGMQSAALEVRAADGVYLLSLLHENGARVVIPVVKQVVRP
jgi:PKD repeat protein